MSVTYTLREKHEISVDFEQQMMDGAVLAWSTKPWMIGRTQLLPCDMPRKADRSKKLFHTTVAVSVT